MPPWGFLMAFSATVVNVQYLGPGKKQLTGTWSGSSGDSAGTMTFAGTVTKADFEYFDNDNAYQIHIRPFSSISSGITTLTINNQDDVTTGYFTVDVLGG